MAVLQLYYTSCRKGLSGYAGFQTRAESHGVVLEDRRDLERMALYKPPRDLPRDADAERFPQSFKFLCLPSGRLALIRSVYVGRDYSNRWGNYFAHSLILEDFSAGCWPIDAYDWSGWVGNLAAGEDETTPEPLNTVVPEEVLGGNIFSFQHLQAFLQKDNKRAAVLALMLEAVFCRASDGRKIVILEHSEQDAAYWIACIQKLFPASCQRELSCSTFQFDPRNALVLNATQGETDFLLNEAERKYEFYVFDFLTGVHSDVTGAYAEYTQTLTEWITSDISRLQHFHNFSALFVCKQINGELIQLLRLYRLFCGEQLDLPFSELIKILEFIRSNAKVETLSSALSLVGYVINKLDVSASAEDWKTVVLVLTDVAAASGEAEYRQYVYQAWVRAFDNFVFEKRLEEDVVMKIGQQITQKFADLSGAVDLARVFLSEEHLEWMVKHLQEFPGKNLTLLMEQAAQCCRQLGYEKIHTAPELHRLIQAFLEQNTPQIANISSLLYPFRSQSDALSGVITFVVSILLKQAQNGIITNEAYQAGCRAVGEAVAGVLGALNAGLRFKVLNNLKQNEYLFIVLFYEWQATIKQAKDRLEAHKAYELNMLSDNSGFARQIFSGLAEKMFKILPKADQTRLAVHWLRSGCCPRLSENMLNSVLDGAACAIALDLNDRDSEELMLQIEEEVGRSGRVFFDERLELRKISGQFIKKLCDANSLLHILGRVNNAVYGEFMQLTFHSLLESRRTVSEHEEFMRLLSGFSTHTGVRQQLFSAAYLAFLQKRRKKAFEDFDVCVIAFWLLFDIPESHDFLKYLNEQSLNIMLERFADMSNALRDKAISDINSQLLSSGYQNYLWEQRRNDFVAQVRALRPTFFGRLQRIPQVIHTNLFRKKGSGNGKQ